MSNSLKVFIFLLLGFLLSISTVTYAGSLSGTITETGTNAPIDSTILELYNTDWFFIGVTTTDIQGNYQFTNLINGDYHLFATGVRVEGLERPKAHIAEYYNNATSRAQANLIAVNGTVSNINLSLAVGNTISGTVRSARDGRPARNTKVVLKEANRTADYATFTDSNGHYQIGGMDPTKEYYVQATGEWLMPEHGDIVTAAYEGRYYPDATSYSGAELIPTPENVTNIDFSLNEKALIYGWITDEATGKGITHCPIKFYDSDWNEIWVANAGSGWRDTGLYISGDRGELLQLSGSYYLKAEHYAYADQYYPGAATKEGAQPLDFPAFHENINFTLNSGLAITGQITAEDGSPIPFGTVFCYDSDWNLIKSIGTFGNTVYTIGGLAPGAYYVQAEGYNQEGQPAYIDEYYPESATRDAATLVEVTTETVTGINFTLSKGLTISGIATDTTGQPIANTTIAVITEAKSNWWDYSTGQTEPSNGDGEYSVRCLLPGTYYVIATGTVRDPLTEQNFQKYYPTFYPGTTNPDSAVAIDLMTDITGINFTLQEGGTISGSVTRTDDGTPIPQAHIQCFDSEWEHVKDVHTDENGTYVIGGLQPGGYYLCASGQCETGNGWEQLYLEEYYQEATTRETATLIQLDGPVTDINFTLEKGVSVSGRVTDLTGQPIANTKIVALTAAGINWWEYAKAEALTGATGDYSISGLASGTYYVIATGRVWDPVTHQEEVVYQPLFYLDTSTPDSAQALAVNTDLPGIDFVLKEGARISGRVTRADDGTPINQANIEYFDSEWNFISGTRSDSTGDYSFDGVDSGAYYVFASGQCETDQGPMQLFLGEYYAEATIREAATLIEVDGATTGIDFTLEAGLSLSGKVTRQDNNSSIANMRVSLFDENCNHIWDYFTNEDGNYEMKGLRSGSYCICATGMVETEYGPEQRYQEEYYEEAPTCETATLLTITSDTTNINFTLVELVHYRFSGHVIRAADQAPLSSARVSVFNSLWEHRCDAFTDSGGFYLTEELAPNEGYFICADGSCQLNGQAGQFFMSEYFPETASPDSAELIQLTGEIENINFTLTAGASIAGTITRQDDGTPVAAAHVELRDSTWNECLGEARTDSSGHYFIGGLAAGDYYVNATGWGDFDGHWVPIYKAEFYPESAEQDAATLLHVAAPVTGINFTLEPGCLVTGYVRFRQDYASVEGAQIYAYTSEWNWVGEAWSEQDGFYAIGNIESGEYYVHATGNVYWDYGDHWDWNAYYGAQYYPETSQEAEAEAVVVDGCVSDIDFLLKTKSDVESNPQVEIPADYALHANYPNPFNPYTQIQFTTPQSARVSLRIYNLRGEHIRELINKTLPGGTHHVEWDARTDTGEPVPSGLYFYRLTAENFSATRKMLLLK